MNIENVSIEQKEKEPGFDDLALFTATFYGEDETSRTREILAEQLLENAAELGIRCVVMDGGSNSAFLEKIGKMDNVKLAVDPSLKMGESRRAALKTALMHPETKHFPWTEPEKDALITKESLSAMIEGLRNGSTDIVVPKRASKESMTEFQAWIETRANKRADELIPRTKEGNEDLDLWFGPKMFNREGARFFENYKGDLDRWDAIIKPVIEAAQAGKRVSSVDVDYKYDPSQTEHEKGNKQMMKKRVEQYKTILKELGDKFWKNK